jgi:rhomboid-like protein
MPTLKVIASIFGPKISRVDGYNVLRILHHRRTSGSLVDYGVDHLGARYSAVTHDQATKALEWLRQTYPIDEARAAEEWAEKEANRIAYELWLADPENADSKYNDPARVWRQQQQEIEELKQAEEKKIGILRQGPSEFELNIARKRKERLEAAARAAEEKERQEQEQEKLLATGEYVRTPSGKQLMKPNEEVYVDIFGREQVSRRKEMLEKYRQKAVSTPFKSEEEMRNATTLVCPYHCKSF